jgi:hypothetical protein
MISTCARIDKYTFFFINFKGVSSSTPQVSLDLEATCPAGKYFLMPEFN